MAVAKAYLSDKSPRTVAAKRAYYTMVVSMVAILVSVVGFIAGSFKYSSVVANSSTAVGTQMKFMRSAATCYLSGLYTDRNEAVLIARISFSNPKESVKLPFKGSDYLTFVSSKALPKDTKTISALTGRLSSDGDMFVVIPKPKPDAVYSLFVMNTVYLGDRQKLNNGSDVDSSLTDLTNQQEKSVTAALSGYNYEQAIKQPGKSAYTIADDSTDMIGFRATLRPSIKDDAHTPTRIDAELLSSSGEFNFKEFFDSVFIKSAKVSVETSFKKLSDQESALKKRAQEMQDRLTINSKDKAATDEYTRLQSDLQKVSQEKQSLADLLQSYTDLKYSDELFSNLGTKARVVKA